MAARRELGEAALAQLLSPVRAARAEPVPEAARARACARLVGCEREEQALWNLPRGSPGGAMLT